MNQPIIITVYGYKSNTEFTINANLIERIQEDTDYSSGKPFTHLYMAGTVEKDDYGNRTSNYRVRETKEQIIQLIKEQTTFQP